MINQRNKNDSRLSVTVLSGFLGAGKTALLNHLLNVIGDDKPRVIQCVQHTNYPYARLDDWPAEAPYNDRKSRLVFIVRGLDQLTIEKAFAMFCGMLDGERREALVAEGRMQGEKRLQNEF